MQIRTNQAPTVKLVENRIQVMTNISFEIFDDAFQQQYDSSSTKESGREEVVGGHQEIVVVGMKNDDDDDEGITGNEKQPENNEEVSNQQRKRNKRSQESRHPEEDKLRRKQKSSSETATIEEDLYATTPSSVEERQEEEDGEETGEGASFRKLAPWTRPLPKQSLLSRPGSSKLIPHVRPVPPGTEQIPGGGGSPEWGESVFGQSSRKAGQVIWPKVVVVGATTSTTMDTPTRNWTWTLPPSPTEPIIFEETTTTTPPTTTTMAEIITTSTTAIQPQQPTQTLRPIVIKVGRPILRIDIHSKVVFAFFDIKTR